MVVVRAGDVLVHLGVMLVVVGLLQDQTFRVWLGSALLIVGCFADRAADIALGPLRVRLTTPVPRGRRRPRPEGAGGVRTSRAESARRRGKRAKTSRAEI